MPDWHHLKVANEREVGAYAEAWLDDIKLKGVVNVDITINTSGPNRAVITLYVGSINKADDIDHGNGRYDRNGDFIHDADCEEKDGHVGQPCTSSRARFRFPDDTFKPQYTHVDCIFQPIGGIAATTNNHPGVRCDGTPIPTRPDTGRQRGY